MQFVPVSVMLQNIVSKKHWIRYHLIGCNARCDSCCITQNTNLKIVLIAEAMPNASAQLLVPIPNQLAFCRRSPSDLNMSFSYRPHQRSATDTISSSTWVASCRTIERQQHAPAFSIGLAKTLKKFHNLRQTNIHKRLVGEGPICCSICSCIVTPWHLLGNGLRKKQVLVIFTNQI